jgi:nucleotide-binding universal stress UspA family protein
MIVLRKILVPFNFSPEAVNAFNYAVHFAETDNNISIDLICVEDENITDKDIKIREAQFQDFLDKNRNASKIQINYTIKKGIFTEEILDFQANENIDIVLIGTKASHHYSEDAITHTSDLVLNADCPVIVVPDSFKEFTIKNITLAVGNKEIDDPKALSTLLAVARSFAANIHVLTIYPENDDSFLEDNKNEDILKYYLERFYTNSSMTISSNIADSIVAYQKKEEIDMLAIIPRNHAMKSMPSEGKLTKFLTMESDIPILTID